MTPTQATTNPSGDAAAQQTQASREAAALAFIAEIRRHCADLPADEIDELIDGLSADLVDRLGEGAELGDAAEYATELRAAAGLPPRGTEKKRASMRDRRVAAKRWWLATPRRRALAEFLATLTPVWWVARGLMVGLVFTVLFRGLGLLTFLLAIAAVVISVQWGRGRWQPNAFVVFLRRAASIGAVIALVPASFALMGHWIYGGGNAEASEQWVQSGLAVDGVPVENVFAYDCAGHPIDGVQLFDASGQPLNAAGDQYFWNESTQEEVRMVPNALASRPDALNVFPLAQEDSASEIKLPFAQASALSDACPTNAADADDSAQDETAAKDAGAAANPGAKSETE